MRINIPIKFHCSNMKIQKLKNLQVFLTKIGPEKNKSKFRFKDLMQTVPRNIPMMFHRSNLKTEEAVRESLRTAKNVKFYKF